MMKTGWERSNELIIPNKETVTNMLQPFLNEKQIIRLHTLSGGLNNSNIKITTDTNETYVLRIFSKNNKRANIEREILNFLKNSFPVPQVLYFDFTSSVFKYPFVLLSWVQGTQLSEIMYEGNKKLLSNAADQAGKLLASIHSIKFSSSGFFDEKLNIQDFVIVNAAQFLTYMEEIIVAGYAVKHLGSDVCSKILKFSQEHAYLIDKLGEQNSLVHSDFNPLNMLVNASEDTINIEGILDWEYAFSGTPLIDIGNMLRYEEANTTGFLEAFIWGYQNNGGLLPAKWLQKAKLLDLIALCGLLNNKECGEVRVSDIERLILNTLEEWDQFSFIQDQLV